MSSSRQTKVGKCLPLHSKGIQPDFVWLKGNSIPIGQTQNALLDSSKSDHPQQQLFIYVNSLHNCKMNCLYSVLHGN